MKLSASCIRSFISWTPTIAQRHKSYKSKFDGFTMRSQTIAQNIDAMGDGVLGALWQRHRRNRLIRDRRGYRRVLGSEAGSIGSCQAPASPMNVAIPDSLQNFIEEQVRSGRYADPDAFVAELVRTEAEVFDRARRGEPIAIDEHFGRRLEVLLDEAEKSGPYIEVTKDEFDAMEREGMELARKRKSP
jgi:Arc/MetJ-type ribon-helix-helix transcriptional regulator